MFIFTAAFLHAKRNSISSEAETLLTLGELLFGTQLIEILQRLFSLEFNRIFEGISLLGNDAVLVALSAVVYWCFDKRRGRLVTYILFFGAYLNFFLKLFVPWPRPPVDLRIVEKNEMGYGFPSGHAQDSTTFWTWISLDFRKRILAVPGIIIVSAVGISRIYLGVHYPAQVIGGWVIGFALAGFGILALRHLPSKGEQIQAIPQLVFAFATLIPLVFAGALGAVSGVNAGNVGGYLFGFSLGALAEDRYVNFKTSISGAKRVFRIVVGIAIAGFFVLALGPILPETFLATSFANAFIRGLAVVLIAPAVFKMIERG